MSDRVWLLIGSMAVVTFALRLSFLILHERVSFAPVVRRGLRYVPYAVLAALVVPALFAAGEAGPQFQPTRLVAALLGALVAWRTSSVILTLSLGMATLWLGKFLF